MDLVYGRECKGKGLIGDCGCLICFEWDVLGETRGCGHIPAINKHYDMVNLIDTAASGNYLSIRFTASFASDMREEFILCMH